MATAPTQTYKLLVEQFQSICLSHMAVKQFQVGEFSDLDVEDHINTFQRFPICFMVPRTSLMDRFGRLTLSFTFIVADISKNIEDLRINTHNNTLMIMQDIFSKIIMTDWEAVDIELETPISFSPFTESYNNNLTGWEAEINVIIKSPFNLCSAAFE